MTKLSAELSRLVDAHILSPAQSQDVEAAARADLLEALEANRPAPVPRESSRSTVIEVLGYAGGALLLGAVIFLGFSFWDELERPARIGVALASFAVPAAGGVALVAWKTRPALGRVLLALACFTAGFAWTVIVEDEKLVGTAVVIVAILVLGYVLIRRHALAVVGCLILLGTWPASLYRITDSELGAALGLVAAGVAEHLDHRAAGTLPWHRRRPVGLEGLE